MSSKSESDPEPPVISPADRALRIITIITFEPALALLIPHGIVSRAVCPALGLVPMFLSAAFGLVHSFKTVKSRSLDDKIDAFLAASLLGILIPAWVMGFGYHTRSTMLLGAYGTMPLIINFCIHTYFAIRTPAYRMMEKMNKKLFETPRCPHCQRHTSVNWRGATREESVHSHESVERYRDDPEDDMCAEHVDHLSDRTERKTAKQKEAPLFKTPDASEDEDPAVLV